MVSKKARILAAIFAAVIGLSVIVPTLASVAYAADDGATADEQEKIADLGNRYKELQAKQKEIDQQINQTQNEKQKQVVINQQIGAQIDTTTQQIDVLTERITLLENNIKQKTAEMEQKQQEYDATYEQFKARLAALSKMPTGSTLGMVLGADSYCQLVDRNEIMNRVAAYDKNLMDTLEQQKQELAEIRSQLESDRKSVEGDKLEMDSKRQELSAKQAETQKQIQDIALLEQQFMANRAEMERQMKQVQAEIDKIYQEIAARSTMAEYVGGEMGHPNPALSQLTSSYGSRFGGSDFHTGVDFSGPGCYGAPVYASNTGEVAKVVTADTPGYGYGKYVIIDHGGGRTTLYAHNSAVLVSEGQTVVKGQQIAQVGSTGWATGPHCHFEIRINGKAVDPLPFLRG